MDEFSKINESCTWQELTEGMKIFTGGNSKDFNTGEWTTIKPYIIEEKCRQCLLCTPVCPDSAIPVIDKRRGPVDYKHCKGCGICAKVCPFGAIEMRQEDISAT